MNPEQSIRRSKYARPTCHDEPRGRAGRKSANMGSGLLNEAAYSNDRIYEAGPCHILP